jgi:hypothetical protein
LGEYTNKCGLKVDKDILRKNVKVSLKYYEKGWKCMGNSKQSESSLKSEKMWESMLKWYVLSNAIVLRIFFFCKTPTLRWRGVFKN